jgi:hypothetical protein
VSAGPPRSHLPALGTPEREEVGHQLRAALVELIDLALVGNAAAPERRGTRFRPFHELVDSGRELSDTVAEARFAIGLLA